MDALDTLVAKAGKENRAREAKSPAPSKEQALKEASFLKGWSKGKPIIRVSEDSTFWQCGKYMTKITFKEANALQKYGLATLTGDPKKGGATLKML